ncbi:MAG TPA: NAD(P)H-binding protein [Pseudolysinimonas sp.]|nr:NAD(P)H-binding protein [Pseudolysinimonas sp.]
MTDDHARPATLSVAVYGATGLVGSHIAQELVMRGHSVIGVARNVSGAIETPVELVEGTLTDPVLLQTLLRTVNAVVVAIPALPSNGPAFADFAGDVLHAVADSGVRLGVVGGAGSLWTDAEKSGLVIDSAELPAAALPSARAHVALLDAFLADDSGADWFVLSPPTLFGARAPGARRNEYRLGDDVVVRRDGEKPTISVEDYAIAFVDELERPRHHRRRFTVGY